MPKFKISFFCYFDEGNHTVHVQELDICDIPNWIAAYKFTHPSCTAVSCKIWFNGDAPDLGRVCF